MPDRAWTDEEFFYKLLRAFAENDTRRHWSLPTLTDMELQKFTKVLKTNWKEIVGKELSEVTRPLAITGKKSRRLIVLASQEYASPWGTWDSAKPWEVQCNLVGRNI